MGCVVFSVSGDSAAAYLFQATTARGATGGGHLAAVASHVDSVSKTEKTKPKKSGSSGDFTIEEVAKHNKKEDIWVIVNRQVLNIINVRLPSHFIVDRFL